MKKEKKKYIDTKSIQAFVDAVERKKGFKRDENLIFRHLVEEIGELSNKLWLYENCPKDLSRERLNGVADELVDIIALTVYIADVIGVDLNRRIPLRMIAIFLQYNVTVPMKSLTSRDDSMCAICFRKCDKIFCNDCMTEYEIQMLKEGVRR